MPFLFALLVAATLARAQPGDEVKLTFLPLNDLTRIDDAGGRGGFARLATAVSDEQRPGRHLFVVHAGGALSPSPISALDRGEHMMGLLASGTVDLVLTSWADALRFAHRENAVAAQSQPQGGRLVAIDVILRRRVVEAPPHFPDNPDSIGDAEIDLGPGDLRSEVVWTANPRIVDTVDLPIDYLMLAGCSR